MSETAFFFPKNKKMTELEKELLQEERCYVIDSSIDYNAYVTIDLSSMSALLKENHPKTAADYDVLLENYLEDKKAKVAYGGYIEQRSLYERCSVFNNSREKERNIHLGVDLWIKAGTPVLAALEGKVHSFQNNNNVGDYGPTIILEHLLNTCTFYTLYGHLSLESIENIKIGQVFSKGEPLATLGDASVNGDYAAHLHFQIISDLEGKTGDYPGVCSEETLSFYQLNCPDPNLLLKI